MDIKKHRTCSLYCERQCKAIEGYGTPRKWCSLGFSIECKANSVDMKPLEPCYKPMTNDDMITAWEIVYKKKILQHVAQSLGVEV